jgi:MFS family permease
MLIPIYLIRACGRSPSATGWLLAPLGVGMICSYPWMGALTRRFGSRKVSAGGAFLAFAATLPFLYLASHGLVVAVLACALFLRGVGLSAVGIPSISAAYASVQKRDLPMATTSLNIVQRLGGPTMTTLCATFLGWRLGAHSPPHSLTHLPRPLSCFAHSTLCCLLLPSYFRLRSTRQQNMLLQRNRRSFWK